MKRLLSATLAALAVTALATPAALAQNLLVNPGFEDPVTSDGPPFVGFWEVFAGGGASSSRDTVDPRNGAGHLAVSITADNTFAGAFQDVEGLSPGQLMDFSLWYKSTSLPFNVISEMRIEWRKVGQAVEVGRTPNLTTPPTDMYSPLSLVAAVPAGADTARLVYAIQSFTNGSLPDLGTVYVDDASFTVVPEPATLALAVLSSLGLITLQRRRRR